MREHRDDHGALILLILLADSYRNHRTQILDFSSLATQRVKIGLQGSTIRKAADPHSMIFPLEHHISQLLLRNRATFIGAAQNLVIITDPSSTVWVKCY